MTTLPRKPSQRVARAVAISVASAILAACSPTEPVASAPPAAVPDVVEAPVVIVPGVLASAALDVERNEISTCNIEAIDGRPFAGEPLEVPGAGRFLLGGFLFDADTQSVPDNLRMRLVSSDQKSAWETEVEGRLDRPGLPEFLGIGNWALRSGFMQEVQVGKLAPDRYHLEVSFERDGKRYVCDNGRDILVRPITPA